MRDNHAGLPEIINSCERFGNYFCTVSLTIDVETKNFEFGIDQNGYKAIKRIISMRPFDQLPGTKYRYFFCPKAGRRTAYSSKTYCSIRIEQEKIGKEFEVDAPEGLIANLMWFVQVKDFRELSHLQEIAKEP